MPRFPTWYGKEHLNPAKTNRLVIIWQSPPGNTAEHYYDLFPTLYPYHLPDDHHIVKYNEELYPKHRDYRNKPEMPEPIRSKHIIEWEDGYSSCNICEECKKVKKQNEEQTAKYYADLEAWKNTVRDESQKKDMPINMYK